MGNVGSNGKRHREAENVQTRGYHPSSAHSEEAAYDADGKADQRQTRPEDVESRNGHIHVQPVHIKNLPAYLNLGSVFDNRSVGEVESGVPHDLVSNETQAASERGGDYRAPDSEHERIGVVQVQKEFCETPLDHTIVRYNNEQVGLSSRGQNQVRKQQTNHGKKCQ